MAINSFKVFPVIFRNLKIDCSAKRLGCRSFKVFPSSLVNHFAVYRVLNLVACVVHYFAHLISCQSCVACLLAGVVAEYSICPCAGRNFVWIKGVVYLCANFFLCLPACEFAVSSPNVAINGFKVFPIIGRNLKVDSTADFRTCGGNFAGFLGCFNRLNLAELCCRLYPCASVAFNSSNFTGCIIKICDVSSFILISIINAEY